MWQHMSRSPARTVLALANWTDASFWAQKVLNKYLLELLPDDSHERCRGKAFVSPALPLPVSIGLTSPEHSDSAYLLDDSRCTTLAYFLYSH